MVPDVIAQNIAFVPSHGAGAVVTTPNGVPVSNSGVPGTTASTTAIAAATSAYFAAHPNILPPSLQSADGQQIATQTFNSQLWQENTGSTSEPGSGVVTVAGQDFAQSGHWGLDQGNDAFFATYNATNPSTPVTTAGIAAGQVGLIPQVQAGAAGWAAGATAVANANPGVTNPTYLADLGNSAYMMGAHGLQTVINQAAPNGLTDSNYATIRPQLRAAAVAAATGNTAAGGSANGANGSPEAPVASAAVAAKSSLSQDNDGTALNPRMVIWDGLDNVPWWKLEGALVGNPKLRRIPDAIQFMLMLPPRDDGVYLPSTQGGTDKVLIRLNTGLTSLSQGSAHQNSIEPTATGILLNVWDSRPDMISASGTTGVFMNLGGLTDLMSCQQSPVASAFLEVLTATFTHLNNTSNGLRVASQDAFMELWALFKNNGLIRYTGSEVVSGSNDAMANTSTNLSGYQMRHRVGDIMDAGYVVMTYKDRTLMGQFKSFDLTANADSPYRWDFNFTFRVLSDFVPYTVNGN